MLFAGLAALAALGLTSCGASTDRVEWRRDPGSFAALVVTLPRERIARIVDGALAQLGWQPDDGGVCHVVTHEAGLAAYVGERPERTHLYIRVSVEEAPSGSRVVCHVAARITVAGRQIDAPSSGAIERRFFDAVQRDATRTD